MFFNPTTMTDDIKNDNILENTDEDMPESTEVNEAVEATEETNVTEESANDMSDQGYQFEDADTTSEPAPTNNSGSRGDRRYANEIFSKTIHAKFRTFYIDLKESVNGKFLKVSEKSRGRKTTIMMDAEDVPEMIKALQEAQEKL